MKSVKPNPGEIAENQCYEFLKRKYENNIICFKKEGGSNSTISDISVLKNGIQIFYVESKSKNAQCGQFVVTIGNDNELCFSSSNEFPSNTYSDSIIDFMQENIKEFSKVSTKPIKIKMEENYFWSWIIDFYTKKNVKYFIMIKELDNFNDDNFVIFPLTKIHKYCEVSAIYRRKKSGSSRPSFNNISEIKEILSNSNFKYSDLEFKNIKNKRRLFVKLNSTEEKIKISGSYYNYMLVKQDDGQNYEVKRLSNTSNPNVIFSIKLKQEQQSEDLKAFENEFC